MFSILKNKKIKKIETSLYMINITKFVVSLISLNDKFDAISFNLKFQTFSIFLFKG